MSRCRCKAGGELAKGAGLVLENRMPGGPGFNVGRAIIGVSYLAAALFNATFTLPRSDELDGYAEGAWFGFLEDFMRDVFMPNGEFFMLLVVIFELIVGIMILSRGVYVDIGVTASVLWVIGLLPFLAWPYLLSNIILAALQGAIMLRSYDAAIWTLLADALRTQGPEAPTDPG